MTDEQTPVPGPAPNPAPPAPDPAPAPAPDPEPSVVIGPKDLLLAQCQRIKSIAFALPHPAVTDSRLHCETLLGIAAEVEAIARAL